MGAWDQLAPQPGALPTTRFQVVDPDPGWPAALQTRFRRELARTGNRLVRLDRRLRREAAARLLGGDPEHLRQALFPFDAPQERVMPGAPWLRHGALLDRILDRMDGRTPLILVEEP